MKLDGKSLLPIIHSADAVSHHKVMHWQWQTRWAVREGHWKLIHERGKTLLVNLADEQPERKNYADDKPDLVDRLNRLHEDWVKEVSLR